jgi:uncharacterized protein (TIGR03067 family)
MQRAYIIAAAVLFVAVPLFAGGGAADLKKMSGTWAGALIEIGGKPPTDNEKKIKIKLVIVGEKYTVFFDEMKITDGTLKLDGSKKPKTIDAMPSEGEHKGKLQPGIYEVDGDELKIVFTDPGKDRPKEFKTREKTDEVMMSYRRVKGGK